MTAPGWYQAQGDPPGTTRYWDGSEWIGDPVPTPAGPQDVWSAPHDNFGSPGSPAGHVSNARLASPGSRIGARIIDFILFLVVGIVFLLPAFADLIDGISNLPDNPTDSQFEAVFEDAFEDRTTSFILAGIGTWALEVVLIAFTGGTIGKLIVGLRIADEKTGAMPPGIPKAILRTLNRGLGLIGGIGASQAFANGLTGIAGLIGLISLIMLFSDARHRTVMDRIAGTVVIRK